jgi:Domain of unknown function (DUF4129)
MSETRRELLIYLGLALLEVTPPALLLTLWGAPPTWGALLVAVLGACAIEWGAQRLAPERWHRPIIIAGTVGLGLVVAAAAIPRGDLAATLLDVSAPSNLIAYAALLCGVYAAWRGVRMPAYAGIGLRELFSRAMGLSLVALLIGGAGQEGTTLLTAATLEVLCGFAAGLGTVALARAAEPGEVGGRASGWRGAAPPIAAIGIVLLAALALTSVFGGETRQLVVLLGDLLILLLTALLVPLVMLLAPLIEWLLLAINAPRLVVALQQWTELLELRQRERPRTFLDDLASAAPWIGPLLEQIGRLMPVLMMLALIWLVVRRRRQRQLVDDLERVSLFSWAGLADDLQGLLARLRRGPAEGGLRAALAAMQGGDPDSRIRRSYLRLLIAAEDRERPRDAPQTPREYMPTAELALPASQAAIEMITSQYERARYAPGSATPEDAEASERAWESLAP